MRNVVAGPTSRKCVERSNEPRMAECWCHFEAASLACGGRVIWPAIWRCDGGRCDVWRDVRVTALCGKQVYCWRQVTLVRTDADTRWANVSSPATVLCGARASWHVQRAAAIHMFQALGRRGAVIARIRYMVVPLAAVRDLRAPNAPEEPGYCLRSTDLAAPQFRGGDLRRDSGAKAHNFQEMGWKRHASNPKVVRCVVWPCQGPPESMPGRIYHIEHVTLSLLLTPVEISA